MKLVIDIHEKDYKSILNSGQVPYAVVSAIMDGTPFIERPKAKWIKVFDNRKEFGRFSHTWHHECSECRAMSYKGFEPLEKYCPKCGAEMIGNVEDKINEKLKGHWIEMSVENDVVPIVFKCSKCGMRVINPYKYCPECGSHNGGEEDG